MKTTYYLGAGASAQTLPCVANLEVHISYLFDYIFDNFKRDITFKTSLKTIRITEKEVIENFWRLPQIKRELISSLKTSLSIDTLARVFYLNAETEKYRTLKGILLAAFTLWEKKYGIDKRYENFWATLAIADGLDESDVKSLNGFVKDINIVSWNYDNQLETSLHRTIGNTLLYRFTFVGFDKEDDLESLTSIPYTKLNGSATLNKDRMYLYSEDPEKFNSVNVNFNELEESTLIYLLCSLILFPNKFESEIDNLKFCWEPNNKVSNIPNETIKQLRDTETLVVIGYSFPSINHRIDREMMKIMYNIKKVYFQGKDKDDSERIMQTFKAVHGDLGDIELNPIESTGFFIPPEATLGFENRREIFDNGIDL